MKNYEIKKCLKKLEDLKYEKDNKLSIINYLETMFKIEMETNLTHTISKKTRKAMHKARGLKCV